MNETMNLFRDFQTKIVAALDGMVANGALPAGLDFSRVAVEPPRDPAHGDLATNAAMVLSKPAGQAPRTLAAALVPVLTALPDVVAVEIAGPGFINLRLAESFWHGRLAAAIAAGDVYGRSSLGNGRKVNVEYVSANPTGPMHVGHGRGAAFGDALANLLDAAGFDVTREYYVNDAGAQVDALARSVHLRYREALGEAIGAIPEGLYPGDYLCAVGAALAARDGRKWLNQPEEAWLPSIRAFAVDAMMALIRSDLAGIGIKHAVFTSERGLVERGSVDAALLLLEGRGLIYTGTLEPPKGDKPDDWEPRPQTLFRATQFGDDTDRPLKKLDGSWTYFATDIAYHLDKFSRGFAVMIDVWGADHGGYVKRMKAAVAALSDGKAGLEVKLCQMVNLMNKGEPVKMSKRAGTFVTLRDVVDEVGKDVVRFIMLTRKNDQHLDFDLAKVTEQSKDNPVFYVQYAHARHRSVMRQAAAEFPDADFSDAALGGAELSRLRDPDEMAILKTLAQWPRVVETAAETHEPHRIAFYLHDLAAAFHALWTRGKDETSLRFIVAGDVAATRARLALARGVGLVVAAGLRIFGVKPVEELR